MPMYLYVVKDAQGKTKKDMVDALNEQALAERLQGEGYFVISVTEAIKKEEAQKKKVYVKKFSHNKTKLVDLLVFARQLATMLESGVPLMRSLTVITEQVESKELFNALTVIKSEVEQGKTLSASLGRFPRIFSPFWVSLVEVGEASGTMPMVLNKLTVYSEQEAAFRSKIGSAMVYPGILMFVCVGAVGFFAMFVAPRFESIFESLHTELPDLTKVLLWLFKFIQHNILMIIAAGAAIFTLFKAYIKTDAGCLAFEKFLFGLPVWGPIFRLIIVERFASQMAILVDSGVPILYALSITEKLVENKTCALIVHKIQEDVREGKLLAEPMEESGFFPSMCVQMIKVGEETGELGQMLKHISAFYQRDVEAFMDRFGSLIEPVMLVVMGGLIGTIVLAMFMPLFNMTG